MKKFISDSFSQNLRCDGRQNLQSRTLEISKNTELLAAGSSQLSIELFSPHIICGIKSEISDSQSFSLSIERAGKSSQLVRERLKEISSILEVLMLKYITKDQFTIIPEKKYWKVYIDVLIIDEFASNLVEQIGLSIFLALKSSQMIGIEGYVHKVTQEVFLDVNEKYWKVNVNDVPIVISIAFYGSALILDLNSDEEDCVESILHVAVDENGHVKGMSKEGAGSLNFFQITQAISIAKEAAKQVFQKIDEESFSYKISS